MIWRHFLIEVRDNLEAYSKFQDDGCTITVEIDVCSDYIKFYDDYKLTSKLQLIITISK